MKTLRSFALLLLLGIAALLVTTAALAQTNVELMMPVIDPSIPWSVGFERLWTVLRGDFGWMAAIVTWMGTLRVGGKLVSGYLQKFLERALARVVETSDTADDHIVERVLNSWFYGILAFVIDMATSLKLPLVLPTNLENGKISSGGFRVEALLLSGGLAAAMLLTGCIAPKYPVQIVSFTQRVIGLDASENVANQTPQFRLGFVSTTYHVVPTGTNVVAPDVSSSIDLSHKPFATGIAEQFSTGEPAKALATNRVPVQSPAK